MKNLPQQLPEPRQTKHKKIYDTVNDILDFLEEKFPKDDKPSICNNCFDGDHIQCAGKDICQCKCGEGENEFVGVIATRSGDEPIQVSVYPKDCKICPPKDCCGHTECHPKEKSTWEERYANVGLNRGSIRDFIRKELDLARKEALGEAIEAMPNEQKKIVGRNDETDTWEWAVGWNKCRTEAIKRLEALK